MYPSINFEQLELFQEEFEDKTQPRYGSTDYQVGNICSMIGITSEELGEIWRVADFYISPEQDDIRADLRSMFSVGFTLAMYSMQKNLHKNTDSIH